MGKQDFLTEKMKVIIITAMFIILTLTIMAIGIVFVLKQDKKNPANNAAQVNIVTTDNSQ
jgi:flagellar basal body-associated protein FliL